MTKIDITAETQKQIAALGALFGEKPEEVVGRVIERFHAAYIRSDGALPEGWKLRESLSLKDLETYYEAYGKEPSGNVWAERGRAIRAAIEAGWLTGPKGLNADAVGDLKPTEAIQVKAALDEHYIRLTTADPK